MVADGRSLQVSSFIVEVGNALLVCYVVTEFLLREPKGKDAVRLVKVAVAGVACNVTWALFEHAGVLIGLDWPYAIHDLHRIVSSAHVSKALVLAIIGPLAAAIVIAVAAVRWMGKGEGLLRGRALKAKLALALQSEGLVRRAMTVLIAIVGASFTILFLSDLGRVEEAHHEALRVSGVCGVFAIGCFLDVRRKAPHVTTEEFLHELIIQIVTLPRLFLFLAICIATVMAVAVGVLETVGIDPHVLNKAIYFSILYGPLGSIYFGVKRNLSGKLRLPI